MDYRGWTIEERDYGYLVLTPDGGVYCETATIDEAQEAIDQFRKICRGNNGGY